MNKGFTLIESLLSILLLAIVVVGGMSFYSFSNQNVQGSIHRAIAMEIANSKMEEIKNDGYAFIPDTAGIWLAKSGSTIIRNLSGSINSYVYLIDENGDNLTDYKQVRIEIDWHEPEKAAQQRIRVDTYISP